MDSYGFGVSAFEILFLVAFVGIFVLVIGGFAIVLVTGLLRWNRNNQSPILTLPATVVTKRQSTSGGSGDSSVSTYYHVTFEIQGHQRLEFDVDGSEFGLLVERDRGQLTYQGTRYQGFIRTPQDL